MDVECARRKYRPDKIRFLLVAEAPPSEGSGRFFYFEDVSDKDSLFLETMKALYPLYYTEAKAVRLRKREFLGRFKADGFYLIDACDSPIEDSSQSGKRRQIRQSLPSLRSKLQELTADGAKIVLISVPVHKVCGPFLAREGFKVINEASIDFPGSGGQAKFREKFSTLLEKHGWETSA